jgi:hypothetical protein
LVQTDKGMVPVPELACPAVTQTCVQINGQKTPGSCLNNNEPAKPVSYAPNSCTHQEWARG